MDSSEAKVRFQLFRASSTAVPSSPTQNIYERATKAELAKDLDTAFRLYIEAGTAFLNLSRAPATHRRAQEGARQCAARAVERAERIKAVKADLAPVWRDPFAHGSSFLNRCVLFSRLRIESADGREMRMRRGATACIAKEIDDQRRRGALMDEPFLESGSAGGNGDGDVVQVNVLHSFPRKKK